MRKASDGFEHGFMNVHDVRDLIEAVLERSMALVRGSLIRVCKLDSAVEAVLLGHAYEEPRGLVPPIFMIRGVLSLMDPSGPPPVEMQPLEIDFPLPEPVAIETPGKELPEVKFEPTITVLRLPSNVSITVTATGLRAANVKDVSTEIGTVHRAADAAPGTD